MTEPLDLSATRYRTIVADPPWDVKRPAGWGTNRNHRSQAYPVMTPEQICHLPVAALAEDSSVLFLWTVNAYVEAAYDVSRAWGFRPTQLLTWCKPRIGTEFGGWFTPTSEFVLFGRRGPLPNGRSHYVDTTWFEWPRRAQSEKPEAFYDLLESFAPRPYLELFARRNRLGWDTWGNEALEHVDLGNPS